MADEGHVLLVGEDGAGGEVAEGSLDSDGSGAGLADVEELRALISQGRERGYLTFEQIAATLEEVEVSKEQVRRPALLPGRARRRRDRRGRPHGLQGGQGRRRDRGRRRSRAGPDRRAQPRLAAPLPALDRPGRPAHRRPGGRAGEADRARRHGGQAAHGRGQPAPGGLDREGLPGPRPHLPRPDPGGLAGADPRGREVRLPARLQVLDVRDLVDPPGGDAGDRRQGADDPDPRPHGREAEPGGPRRAPARAAAGPRAGAGGDRRGAEVHGARGARHPARSRSCRSRWRSRSATRRTPSWATSSPTTRSRSPTRRRPRTSSARTSSGRSMRFRSASAR